MFSLAVMRCPLCSRHLFILVVFVLTHTVLGSVVGSGDAYNHTNKYKNEPLSALKERFGYYESL